MVQILKAAFIALFFSMQFFANATDTLRIKKFRTVHIHQKPTQTWPVEMGYYSPTGIHFGLEAATKFTLRSRVVDVNRRRLFRFMGLKMKDRWKQKHYDWSLIPQIAFFKQKKNSVGIQTNLFVNYSRTRYKGFLYNIGAGLGLQRIWYSGMVYAAKDDGTIKEKNLGTRGYWMPTTQIGFGWDMSKWTRLHNACSVHFRGQLYIPLNYGSAFTLMNFNSITMSFPLNSFSNTMNKFYHNLGRTKK